MIGSALKFKFRLLRLGRQLSEQQIWCLGCDVRAKNLCLKEFGWIYHPRPDKTKGCARLSCTLPAGENLSVWGFGFLITHPERGALWLDRRGFRPRWTARVDESLPIFGINDLPLFRASENDQQSLAMLQLLIPLCCRLKEHEQAVADHMGLSYRDRCLAGWKFNRTAMDPRKVPAAWDRLGIGLLRMCEDMYAPLNTQLQQMKVA